MAAIAGYWRRGSAIAAVDACRDMLSIQHRYGRHGSTFASLPEISFGFARDLILPEDVFDRQPIENDRDHSIFCADVRIDNREELLARFDQKRPADKVADSDLLFNAWKHWGRDLCEHVVGDFALAAWDSRARSLTLLRSPMSLKSMFYHASEAAVAFASMPQGILAIPGFEKRPALDHVALLAGGGFFTGAKSTIFRDISAVGPGEAIIFDPHGTRTIGLTRELPIRPPTSLRQAGEELRVHLDRAVRAQSRRRVGPLASHLSSGRDSSAVSTSAAVGLSGSDAPLIALTAAPSDHFRSTAPGRRLWDESEVAASTASSYSGKIEHIICRSKIGALRDLIDDMHRIHYGPLLNLSNLPWWASVNHAASAKGATVLLAATAGNFSVSAGGSFAINDALSELGIWRWLAFVGRQEGWRWKTLADRVIGPRLPQSAYGIGRKLSGHGDLAIRHQFPIFREPFRSRAERISQDRFGNLRPPFSYRATLHRMSSELDNSERMSLAHWGIDYRDPTADRRLVEFVLSLPGEMLAAPESRRPLYEAAFGDRVPTQVSRPVRRGYQGADWLEQFDASFVRSEFARYSRNSLVADLIDFERVDDLIGRWPTTAADDLATVELYRNKLLGALALANFLYIHFPD